jgi:hypothetical protein
MQECTFRPEQLSGRKAPRGRVLTMSGLSDDAASSSASAFTPAADLRKFEVGANVGWDVHIQF